MRSWKIVIERDVQTGLYVGYVPGWPDAHSTPNLRCAEVRADSASSLGRGIRRRTDGGSRPFSPAQGRVLAHNLI